MILGVPNEPPRESVKSQDVGNQVGELVRVNKTFCHVVCLKVHGLCVAGW